ncbi:alpha/beta hydrolase [Mangrovihabitans endophyticus]|uniref:AB hydrolase-1 domain-containing protein n=1 Tax=Mangrovihabitans endophyticus TaxID=1751298 RepID=A0A8J3FL42_9ACTN|nr:alpha/beta fold hydrolase [Mangrovihabitans endophyticus]GGK75984.1 hypothetical protein GCM10012284_07460 [Mangrovihabitans endophyticus]
MGALLSTVTAPVTGFRLAYASCHPPRRPVREPTRPGFAVEKVRIPAAGRVLAGWVAAADPQRWVVLGHGLGLDKSHSVRHARFLHDAGYSVLMFDFRNHGASFRDKSLTGFNKRFMHDVVAAVRWLRAHRAVPGTRVALYGFSLATFAMLHAVPELPGEVDAVICDSGPSDHPAETVANLVSAGILPVPRTPATGIGRRLLGASYRRCSSVLMGWPSAWPPRESIPLLLLTGDGDRLIPPSAVHGVAHACPRAEIAVFPGAGHMRPMASDPARYVSTVLEFAGRIVGTPERARR